MGYTSPIAADHALFYFSTAAVLGVASFGRWIISLRLKSSLLTNRIRWQRIYFLTTITSGLCWGMLTACFLYFYEISWTIAVVLFITAGIAGGSVVSFSNWMQLNQFYLLLFFAPILFVSFFFPEIRSYGNWNSFPGLPQLQSQSGQNRKPDLLASTYQHASS